MKEVTRQALLAYFDVRGCCVAFGKRERDERGNRNVRRKRAVLLHHNRGFTNIVRTTDGALKCEGCSSRLAQPMQEQLHGLVAGTISAGGELETTVGRVPTMPQRRKYRRVALAHAACLTSIDITNTTHAAVRRGRGCEQQPPTSTQPKKQTDLNLPPAPIFIFLVPNPFPRLSVVLQRHIVGIACQYGDHSATSSGGGAHMNSVYSLAPGCSA